ncbi:hypothetical protein Tco_0897340, partial [Tanacetum coccineum]
MVVMMTMWWRWCSVVVLMTMMMAFGDGGDGWCWWICDGVEWDGVVMKVVMMVGYEWPEFGQRRRRWPENMERRSEAVDGVAKCREGWVGRGSSVGADDDGVVLGVVMLWWRQRWWWAWDMVVIGVVVEARGGGDRIDWWVRSIFGLGRKTHRKTFSATADGGRRWGGGSGTRRKILGEKEK